MRRLPRRHMPGCGQGSPGPMVMHLQMHVHLQVRFPIQCRGTTGHGQMIPEKDHDCSGCR